MHDPQSGNAYLAFGSRINSERLLSREEMEGKKWSFSSCQKVPSSPRLRGNYVLLTTIWKSCSVFIYKDPLALPLVTLIVVSQSRIEGFIPKRLIIFHRPLAISGVVDSKEYKYLFVLDSKGLTTHTTAFLDTPCLDWKVCVSIQDYVVGTCCSAHFFNILINRMTFFIMTIVSLALHSTILPNILFTSFSARMLAGRQTIVF